MQAAQCKKDPPARTMVLLFSADGNKMHQLFTFVALSIFDLPVLYPTFNGPLLNSFDFFVNLICSQHIIKTILYFDKIGIPYLHFVF